MSLLRPPVRDDRGRRVPLPSPLAAQEFIRSRGAAGLPPYRWNRKRLLPVLLMIPAVVALIVLPALWPDSRLSMLGLPLLLIAVPACMLLDRRLSGREEAERYLHAGLCASCFYDLSMLPEQPDGCTVCPECGAAWRLKQTGPRMSWAGEMSRRSILGLPGGRARDDRGAKVRLIAASSAAGKELLRSAGKSVERREVTIFKLGVLLSIIGFSVWAIIMAMVIIERGPRVLTSFSGWWKIGIGWLVWMSVFLVGMDLMTQRAGRKTLLASARRVHACAACGYGLAGLAREPDGCTLCPECGAAWRLEGEGTEGQRDEGTEGIDSV